MPVSPYKSQELLGEYGSFDIFPNDTELVAVIVDLLSNCLLKSLLNAIYQLPKNRSLDPDTPALHLPSLPAFRYSRSILRRCLERKKLSRNRGDYRTVCGSIHPYSQLTLVESCSSLFASGAEKDILLLKKSFGDED